MFVPCLFAALTTAIAFLSLIMGDIKPVIEFGKMMSVGMIFAFIFTFTYLPSLMKLVIKSTHTRSPNFINKIPLDKKILLTSTEEILKPLRVVRESLEQNQNENVASGDLLDLMRRAKCFGINLARLDIRLSRGLGDVYKRQFSFKGFFCTK